MELLGGSATPMSFGEVYTALQQKVIDGAENNELALTNNKHGEVAKYYSYNQHAMIPDILIMNAKLLDSLSEEHRNIILDAVDTINKFEVDAWEDKVNEAVEQAKEMGVEFYCPSSFTVVTVPSGDTCTNLKSPSTASQDASTEISTGFSASRISTESEPQKANTSAFTAPSPPL